MDRCECCGRRMRLIDKERRIANTFDKCLSRIQELGEERVDLAKRILDGVSHLSLGDELITELEKIVKEGQ